MKTYRNGFICQKTKPNMNVFATWPEKKRSPPKVRLEAIGTIPSGIPKFVKLIVNALRKIRAAKAFAAKGVYLIKIRNNGKRRSYIKKDRFP